MRRCAVFAFCLLASLSAGCVSAPHDLPGPNSASWNAESPRGTWAIVAYEIYGHRHLLNGTDDQFVFTDSTIERHGPTTVQSGTYTVDPTQVPTGIDVELATAPADEKGQKVYPGIYKVANGTLTLCLDMAATKRARPRSFSTASSSHTFVLYICRRVG